MAIPPETFQRKQWMLVDFIRILEIKKKDEEDGDVRDNKWERYPEDDDDAIEIIAQEGMLWYRILDDNLTVIETGAFPMWMVVSVTSLT